MKNFDFLLHLKSLDVFLILVIGGLFRAFKFEDLPMLTAILSAIGMLFLGGWPVIIGHRLHHYFPGLNKINYTLFTIASIIWLLLAVLVPFILAFTNQSFVEIITIPGAIFSFLIVLFCAIFTTNLIESVEAKKPLDLSESLGSLLLMLFLPLGVFFFQPMIRKAMGNRLQETSFQH